MVELRQVGLPRRKMIVWKCPQGLAWPLLWLPCSAYYPLWGECLDSTMPSLCDRFKLWAKISHSSFRFSRVLWSELRLNTSIHKQLAPRQPPTVGTKICGCTISVCKTAASTWNLLILFLFSLSFFLSLFFFFFFFGCCCCFETSSLYRAQAEL